MVLEDKVGKKRSSKKERVLEEIVRVLEEKVGRKRSWSEERV